jgi:outer membrane protein assembly factor BamB
VKRANIVTTSLLGLLTLILAAPADAQWAQFRGPTGDGLAPAAHPPLRWSETENIRWKTAIAGRGRSSPVVLNGRIWLTRAVERGVTRARIESDDSALAEHVSLGAVCLDSEDGKILWEVTLYEVDKPPHVHWLNSWATPTPVVEPGRLYCDFGTYGTACLDSQTGKVLWKRQLPVDHQVGPGSSPILYKDLLILVRDGRDAQYVVALDKKTGQVAWKMNRPKLETTVGNFKKSFSTPLVIQSDGRTQMVIPGAEWVVSYDPATGKELWRVRHGKGFSLASRPVFGQGLVYITTGASPPNLVAIRVDGQGDVSETHVAWRSKAQIPLMSSPILVGSELYFVSDAGIASCVDGSSGKLHWRNRLGGKYLASPTYADGRLYFLNDEGKATVLRAGKTFEQLAENTLPGPVVASPAFLERAIFLRTDSHLYRIESAGSGLGGEQRPMLIVNEDNDHYFKQKAELMTEAALQAYIDRFANTKVTHFFMCPNGQRTSYRSAVHEAIWDPVAGTMPNDIWCVNAKLLHDQGIDPYRVWIARCREKGISPWLTMRMNDVHFVTTPNYFRNTTFWRTRPDLWRVPNAKSGAWTDCAFDYSHQEVRDYHLALVRELFERYDVNGFELDWMRFGYHLTPGKEKEQSPILTEFTREVRRIAKTWEAKRGHPIQLAARIPSHPDAAAGLGMDGVRWAKEGLVDLLVVSPFFSSSDFDIPLEVWQERLGEQANKVRVVPAIDNGLAPYPGAPRIDNDRALLYGWAASSRYRGADSFYLFNWIYFPLDKPAFRPILDKGLDEETVVSAPRRHPVCYRDTVPKGFSSGSQLPKTLDKPVTFVIPTGKKPSAGKATVILGLADQAGVKEAACAGSLNGNPSTACAEVSSNLKKYGAKTARALCFEFPLDAVRDGTNTVVIAPKAGTPQQIIWAEIAFVP